MKKNIKVGLFKFKEPIFKEQIVFGQVRLVPIIDNKHREWVKQQNEMGGK